MAKYSGLVETDNGTDWYLMSPNSLLEALCMAWLLWRHPERIAALVGVSKEFALKLDPKPEVE